MTVTVHLAAPLRRFVDGGATVTVAAGTLAEAIAALGRCYPALAANIFTSSGEVRSFIRVFVNHKDARFLDADGLRLGASDTITLLPAIAGG